MIAACDRVEVEAPEVFRELIKSLSPAALALAELTTDEDEDEIRALYQDLRNEDADPEYLEQCMARLRELQTREAHRMASFAEAHHELPAGAVQETFARVDELLARYEGPASEH